MIDFKKELEKFDFFDIDRELQDTYKEVSGIFNVVNSTFSRFSKEQGKTNIRLDELTDILEEEKEKNEMIGELKLKVDNSEKERVSIIRGIIEILDQVEYLYRLFINAENESLKGQLSLMWELISKTLISIGVTRIDDKNTVFDPSLNLIVETSSNTSLDEGVILDVLKSGYIYKGVVVRRSEVIANKHTLEESLIEEVAEVEKIDEVEVTGEMKETEEAETTLEMSKIEKIVEDSESETKKEAKIISEEGKIDDRGIESGVKNGVSAEINKSDISTISVERQINIPTETQHLQVGIKGSTRIKGKGFSNIKIKDSVDVLENNYIIAELENFRDIHINDTFVNNTYIDGYIINIGENKVEKNYNSNDNDDNNNNSSSSNNNKLNKPEIEEGKSKEDN